MATSRILQKYNIKEPNQDEDVLVLFCKGNSAYDADIA